MSKWAHFYSQVAGWPLAPSLPFPHGWEPFTKCEGPYPFRAFDQRTTSRKLAERPFRTLFLFPTAYFQAILQHLLTPNPTLYGLPSNSRTVGTEPPARPSSWKGSHRQEGKNSADDDACPLPESVRFPPPSARLNPLTTRDSSRFPYYPPPLCVWARLGIQ